MGEQDVFLRLLLLLYLHIQFEAPTFGHIIRDSRMGRPRPRICISTNR